MTHTSTEKPEALRLADVVERLNVGVHSQAIAEEYSAAARELRRLHARVQELEEKRLQMEHADACKIIEESKEYGPMFILRNTELHHGITQEKQG